MTVLNIAGPLAAASGVLAHLAVFRSGEWDEASPAVVRFYASVFAALSMLSLYTHSDVSIPVLLRLGSYHVAGLFASILVYRAFFHRLRKFPGPFLARLSNFYITALSLERLQLFAQVKRLHQEYGDYVRLGPRELSIADPAAIKAIYGSQSPTKRGPFYTVQEPRVSLFNDRDKKQHAHRRRVWDQGFTNKAIQGYDARITKAINQLLAVIDQSGGQPLNVSRYFAFLGFDIMEDLAFNKSPNMVAGGKEDFILRTIRDDMYGVALFTHLSWVTPLVKRTPLLNSHYKKFWAWIRRLVEERSNNEPDQPDIFSGILDAYLRGPRTQQDERNLHGDAQLIVIAGSDTVASALAMIFFHLAWDPALAARLRRELDALPDLSQETLAAAAAAAATTTATDAAAPGLLDAVIHETLRLHPPVPSGTQRETPPEGLDVAGVRVPGDVIVQVPWYTVFRDERAFAQPNEFIPERWTTRPELIRDKSAYIPFGGGPYACVGKRLAMVEMRRVTAEIVSRYDIAVAPGQSKEQFLDGVQDTFTTVAAPLHLIFTKRAESEDGKGRL